MKYWQHASETFQDRFSKNIVIMPITQVEAGNNRQQQNIANILASSKKVIVVVGAGISTNCGIPVSFHVFVSSILIGIMWIYFFLSGFSF